MWKNFIQLIKVDRSTQVLFLAILLPITLYIADYNFFYQEYYGIWTVGGCGDLLYLFPYFVVGIGMCQLHSRYIIKL